MSLTRKGTGWELLQSWYILLTLPFGFTSFLAFLYAFLRVKKASYLAASAIYLAAVVALFYFVDRYPDQESRPEWFSGLMAGFFGLWILSVLHALWIRKDFLLRLEAVAEKATSDEARLRSRIRKEMGVSRNPVNDVLVEYSEDDLSVRVCSTIMNNLPFAPNLDLYGNVAGAVRRLHPDADEDMLRGAEQIAEQDAGVLKAVKTGIALDRVDGGLGIYTGIKNSIEAIKNKDRKRTFEADPQQAADAGVKALALAYIIASLYDGSPVDRVRSFLATKAGQEALIYFAAIEMALPFTDNLAEASGNWMASLLSATEDEAEKRFGQFADADSLTTAREILQTLSQSLDQILNQTRHQLGPFIEKMQQVLPSILNVTDSVTGGAATALDLLPIWKFLCARIAAEACAIKATR